MKPVLQFFLPLLFFSPLAACKPHPGPSKPPVSVPYVMSKDQVLSLDELATIRSLYERKPIGAVEVGDRDPIWTPEAMLPRLSTWFQVGRGLRPAEFIYNSYLVYPLAPVPDQLILELEKVLIHQRYSLSILTIQFWKEVQAAQKLGLKIGFISSRSNSMASGVYFFERKQIALNIVSEPGTLPHELRHHLQYSKLARNFRPQFLTAACLQTLRTAFGEIDATTFELTLYKGIETEFGSLVTTPRVTAEEMRFPQVDLFHINLGYPGLVSQKVIQSESCPDDVKAHMKNVSVYFADQAQRLTSSLMSVTGNVAKMKRNLARQSELQCSMQSSPQCQRLQEQIENFPTQFSQDQQEFHDLIEKEVSERPVKFREFLEGFSPEVKSDLCAGALGVQFYLNCEER